MMVPIRCRFKKVGAGPYISVPVRCRSKKDDAYVVPVKIGSCRSGAGNKSSVPVHICLCWCGAGIKRTVPMWCRSYKFVADLCRSRIIGAGRYRRPEVGAGQIYLVPHRGLWSNVCAHWCPLVPIGIEKVAKSKELLY